MMQSVRELLERLNSTDEVSNIEAKKASAIDRSLMETVCAFSNEPGLGGGIILLGVERDDAMLFPYYKATGIQHADKLQLDIGSQAANMFNIAIRPTIEIEQMNDGALVAKVFIPELPDAQKPVYFKNEGLPRGAYRRIGSGDQRCTEDDLYIFYNQTDKFDSSVVVDATMDDLSEDAIALYRTLRQKVKPEAEELKGSDHDLLWALGAIKKNKTEWQVTYAGLLVFGRRLSLRRLLPMVRVDYIRVPGNEWVADPDNRFTTVDMRGPLIELVQRTITTIADDLPKGFRLQENSIQADSVGLPEKVLREAIVNAFIHRSYRINQPIQIIRYGNRLEIKNPGFSLKPEDDLGEPGSMNRNPFIAEIFHETNLAETKGSGIRTMRKLMEEAQMVPPTFESDHSGNEFTARLLLHHLLQAEDFEWLKEFQHFGLSEAQKKALIFVRETGAINNPTYRQINACDIVRASADLRQLRDLDLLEQKGKSRSTYYKQGPLFDDPGMLIGQPVMTETTVAGTPSSLADNPGSLSGNPSALSGNPPALSGNPSALSGNLAQLKADLPLALKQVVEGIGKRSSKDLIATAIIELCRWKELTVRQLAHLMNRNEKYLTTYVTILREAGKIAYTIPEMPNHPDQAYKSVEQAGAFTQDQIK